jgi:head-tail adaptor
VRAGALTERVAFDAPAGVADAFGGSAEGWVQRRLCWAQWIYGRGDAGVKAAREAGRKAYKVRIRSSADARAITEAWRMRDVRRGTVWSIVEVDAVTDRAWVHITVEGPQVA